MPQLSRRNGSQQSVLTVVNALAPDASLPSQPSVWRAIPRDHLIHQYRSPTGSRLFRTNCMSIVSNSIINADAEAYLSPGELDQIKAFVTGGQRRLRVAQVRARAASAS